MREKRKNGQAKMLRIIEPCENVVPQEENKTKRRMNSSCLRGIGSGDEEEG
jgi:hypothetical protein